jgi:hydrogenase/urease accessory protein HupE
MNVLSLEQRQELENSSRRNARRSWYYRAAGFLSLPVGTALAVGAIIIEQPGTAAGAFSFGAIGVWQGVLRGRELSQQAEAERQLVTGITVTRVIPGGLPVETLYVPEPAPIEA